MFKSWVRRGTVRSAGGQGRPLIGWGGGGKGGRRVGGQASVSSEDPAV